MAREVPLTSAVPRGSAVVILGYLCNLPVRTVDEGLSKRFISAVLQLWVCEVQEQL